jgi:hypothetical protein
LFFLFILIVPVLLFHHPTDKATHYSPGPKYPSQNNQNQRQRLTVTDLADAIMQEQAS